METEMTEYERRRLENVKRNADMMSSLKINSILANLSSSSFKRPRRPIKIYEKSRSSSRAQGIPPSHPSGLLYDIQPCKPRIRSCDSRPISMRNVYKGDEESHQSFVETLSALEMNSVNNPGMMTEKAPVNIESFKLESENVSPILPERLTVLRFLPTSDTVVIAGNNTGHLGFWKVKPQDGDEDGKTVHLYQLQSGIIYGISVHPFSPTKVYSSCSDGILRMMNIEREEFEVVYSSSSESSLYSLSQAPNDANSIFIGEGRGALNMYDVRAGKVMNSWLPHKERINSIDINPANTNVIATASTDGLACIWDLRKMSDQHSECKVFKAFSRERSVRSAYFSPSGSCLAITSWAHDVVVLNGANLEDVQKIHECHGHSSLSSSSAIWGWDDTYLYTGCQKRRALVLSVAQGKIARSLESSFVSSIPWQIAAHPSTVGMLAGASVGGTVFMWTGHNF